jgi:hypothetical protein
VFVWRQPPPGERPDITSSEWFITPPVANGTMTVSTSTDAYNYLRFTDDYVFMTAQRLGYAAALGVGVSAIQFGYAVTAIDYTPTNVPEPSTVLLSGLGVLACWVVVADALTMIRPPRAYNRYCCETSLVSHTSTVSLDL